MCRLIACGAGVLLVLSVAVASASAIDRPQTFSMLEIDESDASVDLGFDFQRLPRPGDQFAFKSGLYQWAGTKRGVRVGRDEGHCIFVRVAGDAQHLSLDAHCAASFFLPAGSVVAEAFLSLPEGALNADIPVVGGTGAYANARGFVHIRDLGTGDTGHTSLTFHLLP
ncbi:MAG TPA: hypothetical protein VFA88_01490 [Gaiellaceae bacterium]|nr:hypothetical protein [Gaiellaceae bacterium]